MSWHAHAIVIHDTYDSSTNLALSVEQFVARTIETIDLSLQVVSDEIGAGRTASPEGVATLLAERLLRSPQITGLAVIDAEGRVRASSEVFQPAGAAVADATYFRLARERDGIRITLGDPRDPSGQGKQVILSRRLAGADGRFAGVVAAALNRYYLQQFFYTLRIGEQGIIAVNTVDGTALVRRPYREDYVGRNFGATSLFRERLKAAASGVFPMRYGDGLWRIVGYQRVEALPLVVQVALSRDEALAHWRSTALVQAGAGAALLLILSLMALRLNRELSARLLAHEQLRATVSELERARLAAETSSRVKSQFMAHMSHELRTPLNAIIGFSEMIRDALMGPVSARYRDYANDIHSSGTHLLRLINGVLDLSKVEAGKLELHEETIDLAKLVEECRRLVADRVTAGGLALAIELPPALPAVRGDELRLKQIVLNLLSNGVKFTPPGGRVRLTAARTAEGGIALSVDDTGIGMTEAEIPVALEPFRQLDSAFSRRFEGTGLGLPLARRLAELHGGGLAIASAQGRGTTATLTLPASRVAERAPLPLGPRAAVS
ncbi:MAG: ATP-binding protein [Stellaceae bacterium]